MPGATTKTQIPTMLDTDPMANVAKANRDMANLIDGRIPKGSTASVTTDSSGNATFTHGLGYQPAVVVCCLNVATLVVGVPTFNTTTCTVNIRQSTSGAVYVGTIAVRWVAF